MSEVHLFDLFWIQSKHGRKVSNLLKPILPALYNENRNLYIDVVFKLFSEQIFIDRVKVSKVDVPFSLYPNRGLNKSVNEIVNILWS